MNWLDYKAPNSDQYPNKLTEGDHYTKITDAQLYTTKSFKPQLKIKLATDNNQYHNQDYYLTEKGLEYLQKFIISLNFNNDQLNDINPQAFSQPDHFKQLFLEYTQKYLVGKLIKIKLIPQTDNKGNINTDNKGNPYLTIAKSRLMTPEEINNHPNLPLINLKFKDQEQEKEQYQNIPQPTHPTNDDDVPF